MGLPGVTGVVEIAGVVGEVAVENLISYTVLASVALQVM